jgi:3'-phosphoadenosine 5'-phosphosulfate sulfotransferase (PAPS reductase)/FAD synthetase
MLRPAPTGSASRSFDPRVPICSGASKSAACSPTPRGGAARRRSSARKTGLRPVRVLCCIGMRAQESRARAKMSTLVLDERGSSSNRTIDNWLPLFAWSEEEVWERVRATGLPVHPAYALGMSRASCSLCVLSSKKDLVRATRLRPQLAKRYADVEARTGHAFRKDLSMREIVELARQTEQTAN